MRNIGLRNTGRRLPRYNAGFTYIGVLLAVALLGAVLAEMATVWGQVRQRENEVQLLFVGDQFRQAIASYYESSPGQAKQYPKKLEDLVLDSRFPFIKRHLRKIFHDPVTGSTDWGLVKDAAGGIIGVYSKSDDLPLKQANFDKLYASFAGKQHYADWQFAHGNAAQQSAAQSAVASASTVENIPAGYQPSPPPIQQAALPTDRKGRLCALMHNNDMRICLNMLKKFGDEAVKFCLDSSAMRYNACLNDEQIPVLEVQYQ